MSKASIKTEHSHADHKLADTIALCVTATRQLMLCPFSVTHVMTKSCLRVGANHLLLRTVAFGWPLIDGHTGRLGIEGPYMMPPLTFL